MAVRWRWAAHLDRKHRGEKQELEVSLRGGEGRGTEVPSPLLTELRVVSGGGGKIVIRGK